MNAETLHCQSCGAAVTSDAPLCEHCGARLAVISCPRCFGMMFLGAKFCPRCGSAAAEWRCEGGSLPCPACAVPMMEGALAETRLCECGKCYGIWLDPPTFERICHDSEQQAAVLGEATLGPSVPGDPEQVRYRHCPVCQERMNRVNFAECSGVVVDVCRQHGTWFDRNELQRIVEFIRAGGLDRARERKKADLAAEERRLEAARLNSAMREPVAGFGTPTPPDLLSLVVGSAGSLLRHWRR